ncbi:MAG TPA: hypothetical protein VNO19_03125 [Gemmatimonadales bacterium]|nr:hypothetical protein [Gemmatimonadales bacterium]
MRSAFLFPLSLSLVVVAGCGSQVKEHSVRSDLKRDLTLVSRAPQTAVATSIELGQIRTPAGSRSTVSSRHKVRHRAAARSSVSVPKPVQVAAEPAPVPAVVQPTNTAPADPRELAPGKTVSIIPASSGISDAEGADGFSAPGYGTGGSGMGGGRAGGGSGMGGDCPRPDFGPAVGIRGGMRGRIY